MLLQGNVMTASMKTIEILHLVTQQKIKSIKESYFSSFLPIYRDYILFHHYIPRVFLILAPILVIFP
jgi:hypothetical protein